MSQLETPVALIVFNDPETTRRVFAAVAAARPKRLFLIADGPRVDRPGEGDRCEEVKRIVTDVNWPCQVETNFSRTNMGPRSRIVSGINWVFSRVEEAIILEHDCLPDPSFFPYCVELLSRYRDQHQIAYITGFNPLEKSFPFRYSYYYSQIAFLWGWATWRRAWQAYDEHLQSWPEVKSSGLLDLVLADKSAVAYWSRVFDAMHDGTGPSTWDYQFIYTCWTRNWLAILPARNLIQYIGFVPGAVHTKVPDPDLSLCSTFVNLPLLHPPAITSWPAHALEMQRKLFVGKTSRIGLLKYCLLMRFPSVGHKVKTLLRKVRRARRNET
jgi:hypothetical protein